MDLILDTGGQRVLPLPPTAYERMGYSVAVYGTVAAIGAPASPATDINSGQQVPNCGKVYIFTLEEETGTWTCTQVLGQQAEDGPIAERYGEAVSISSAGLIIGAPDYNGHGAIYLLQQPIVVPLTSASSLVGTEFTTRGLRHTPLAYQVAGSGFGAAVWSDSSRTLVGAPTYNQGAVVNAGAVQVFSAIGTSIEPKHALAPSAPRTNGKFGAAVCSNSYDRFFVGAPGESACYFFRYYSSVLYEAERKAGAANTDFGATVVCDNENVAVGAPRITVTHTRQGAVYLYKVRGNTNPYQGRVLSPAPAADYRFGRRLALVHNLLYVGETKAGYPAVHAYTRTVETWSYKQLLVQSSSELKGENFAISNHTLLFTAPNADTSDQAEATEQTGVAYFLYVDHPYTAREGQLAVEGGTALETYAVAATNPEGRLISYGNRMAYLQRNSAKILIRNGDNWAHEATITGLSGSSNDRLASIALGENLFVGTDINYSDTTSEQGQLQIYEYDGSWNLVQQITGPNLAYARLGLSIVVHNREIMAKWRIHSGGASYIKCYRKDPDGVWREKQELTVTVGGFETDRNSGSSIRFAKGKMLVLQKKRHSSFQYGWTVYQKNTSNNWVYEGNVLGSKEYEVADVDAHGDWLVAGAPTALAAGSYGTDLTVGELHLFKWNGSTWVYNQKITDPYDWQRFRSMGSAGVTIDKDVIAAGSRASAEREVFYGVVRTFTRSGDTWTHKQEFVQSEISVGMVPDQYRSVHLHDGQLMAMGTADGNGYLTYLYDHILAGGIQSEEAWGTGANQDGHSVTVLPAGVSVVPTIDGVLELVDDLLQTVIATIDDLFLVIGPVGIVSEEAFGVADIVYPQTISAQPVLSQELFGVAVLLGGTGAQNLVVTGIPSGEVVGVGEVRNAQTVTVTAGIPSEELFGPTIVRPATVVTGPQTVVTTAMDSGEVFGDTLVTVSIEILPDSIPSEEVLGNAALVNDAPTNFDAIIAGSGIPSEEGVGEPLLSYDQTLFWLTMDDDSGFGESVVVNTNPPATVTVRIVAISLESEEAFGGVELQIGPATIEVDGIPSEEAATDPVLNGSVEVFAESIVSAEAVSDAVVEAGTVPLLPDTFGGSVVGEPSLTIRPPFLEVVGIESGEAFGNATLQVTTVTVSVTGIPTEEFVSEPSLSNGGDLIHLTGIASEEVFGDSWFRPVFGVSESFYSRGQSVPTGTLQIPWQNPEDAADRGQGSKASATLITIGSETEELYLDILSASFAVTDPRWPQEMAYYGLAQLQVTVAFGADAANVFSVYGEMRAGTEVLATWNHLMNHIDTHEHFAFDAEASREYTEFSGGSLTLQGLYDPDNAPAPSNAGFTATKTGGVTLQPNEITAANNHVEQIKVFLKEGVIYCSEPIPSGEAFGGVQQINKAFHVTGIASEEAFGTFQANQRIYLQPAESAEAFGTASVEPQAVTLTVSGIGGEETVSAGAEVQPQEVEVYPTGIVSAEVFSGATVEPQEVYIETAGIGSEEAFGTIEKVYTTIEVFASSIESAEIIPFPLLVYDQTIEVSTTDSEEVVAAQMFVLHRKDRSKPVWRVRSGDNGVWVLEPFFTGVPDPYPTTWKLDRVPHSWDVRRTSEKEKVYVS